MNCVILHVEDDPNDLLFVGSAFKKVAPEVQVVQLQDGQAAITYLAGIGDFADRSRHPLPHLVLLDVKLPRKTGLEILDWMGGSESLKKIPVVFLSSSKDPSDVARAEKLGAHSYLVKPIEIPVMRELVSGVAALAALQAALHSSAAAR